MSSNARSASRKPQARQAPAHTSEGKPPSSASAAAARAPASPLLDFQRLAGNETTGRMIGGLLVQAKLRDAEDSELLPSAEAPTESPPAGAAPPSEAPAEPSPEAPAAESEPAPAAVVVDDETETIGPGQMRKSEFFTLLRAEVCAAAEAGLAGTQYSAQGCPLIEFWLGYYEGQETERINRDLPRFAGEGPRPESAEAYVSLIAERVGTSVSAWARTGEITGVPKGIPLPGMGLPGLGALGGLLGGGGVFFKARPGGARDAGDPAALQARLGAGRPLDGSIRSRMESAFGRGFAHVRVHDDGGAVGLATSLNAKAFTVGEHVAFGAQEYRPGTVVGDALIAHELAHVAQQDAGMATAAGYGSLERDADLAGASAVASLWGNVRSLPRPEPRLRSGLRLQRCGGCGSKKATTTPTAAGPPAACEPTGESLSTVTAAASFAEAETTLGYTTIDTAASQLQCRPDFTPGAAPGTCSFTPRPVRLELISKYVKPRDDYPHPTGRTMSSACGELPIVFKVTDDIANLAKQGEQEHCADIKLAFERTLQPCSEALARLAGTAMAGRNPDECFADLQQKLGFNPAACTREFIRLRDATAQRDSSKWHTFEPYRVSADCDTGAHYQYRPARSNRIADRVPSSAVVPAATGCSGPAAAPATPEKETP